MIRKIIKIDEEKCNGCGLCISACHEKAIVMVKGKAKLLRDDYCDGLGNCLPVCPANAISFEEREAVAFNEYAVKMNTGKNKKSVCGCPGTQSKEFKRNTENKYTYEKTETYLNQWPVQIKLVSPNAAYLKNASLLIAADCTAYSYSNFHSEFMKNKITLIGCPKLDETDYSEKLTEIIKINSIKSIIVVKMEVPCCGSIEYAVKTALKKSGKLIPLEIITISTDGRITE